MRSDLIRAVLDCGNDDLCLLDNAGADMYETVNRMREDGMEITLQSIMREIFIEGIFRLSEAVDAFRDDLKQDLSLGMMEARYEQLKALRDYNIDPVVDFQYYLNFQDTHLFAPANKRKVYEDLFEQELHDLENYTGFDIEW